MTNLRPIFLEAEVFGHEIRDHENRASRDPCDGAAAFLGASVGLRTSLFFRHVAHDGQLEHFVLVSLKHQQNP